MSPSASSTITVSDSGTISVTDTESRRTMSGTASSSPSGTLTLSHTTTGTATTSTTREQTSSPTLSDGTTSDSITTSSTRTVSESATGPTQSSTGTPTATLTKTLMSLSPTRSATKSVGTDSESSTRTISLISLTRSATRSRSATETETLSGDTDTASRPLTVISRSSISRSVSEPTETVTQTPTETKLDTKSDSQTETATGPSGTRTGGTNTSELTESLSISVSDSRGSSSVSLPPTPTVTLLDTISSSVSAPTLTVTPTLSIGSETATATMHATSTTAAGTYTVTESQGSRSATLTAGNLSETRTGSLEPTPSLTKQMFPPWASALEDASVGIAGASVLAGLIASIVGGASPLSVLAAQRVNMLATFRKCRAPDPEYALSVLESPTQLSIGSDQPGGLDSGAALGNTLIIGLLSLTMYLVAKWKTVSKDRNLAETLNNIYFPPLLSCVALGLWQPMVAGAAGGMAFGSGPAPVLVSVLVFLVALAVWIALFYFTLFLLFRPTFVWKRVQVDEAEKRGGLLKKGDWNPFFFYMIEKPIPKPPKRQGPANPLEVMADAISYRQGEWRVEEKVLRGVHKPSYIRDLPSVERGARPLASVMSTTSGETPMVVVGGEATVAAAAQEEQQQQPYELTRREYFWWRNAHDAFFFFVTDRARWFLVAEWVLSLFFGLMTAISRKLSCTVAGALLFLPLVVYIVLLLWLRPYAVNFDNVSLAALAILMCGSLIFVLLAVNASGADAFPVFNPNSGLMKVNEAILLFLGILILLRALSDLFRVLRMLWRDRQKAKSDEEAKLKREQEAEARKAQQEEEERQRQITRLENPLLDPETVAGVAPEKLQHYQNLVEMGEMDAETAQRLMAAERNGGGGGDGDQEEQGILEELQMGATRFSNLPKLQPRYRPPGEEEDDEVLSIGSAELDENGDDSGDEKLKKEQEESNSKRKKKNRRRSEDDDDFSDENGTDEDDDEDDPDVPFPSSILASRFRPGGSAFANIAAAAVSRARKLQRGNPDDEMGVDETELQTLPQKIRAAYAKDRKMAKSVQEAKRRGEWNEEDSAAAGGGGGRGGKPKPPKPIDPSVLNRGGNMLAFTPNQSKKYADPKKIGAVVHGKSFRWDDPSSSDSSSSSGGGTTSSSSRSSSNSSKKSSVLSVDMEDDDGDVTPPPLPKTKTAASTAASPNAAPASSAAPAPVATAATNSSSKMTPPSSPVNVPPPQPEKFTEPTPQKKRQQPASAGKQQDPFIGAILSAHNSLRAKHGAPPLEWDDDCAAAAGRCASQCHVEKKMVHCHMDGDLGDHGQNISWSSEPNSAEAAVQMWYSESIKPGYNFAKDGAAQKGTGHFTQLVWMATRKVGAAMSADGKYLVCNYFPAGNMGGEYVANVKPAGTVHRSPTRGPPARRPTPPDDHSPATAPSTPPERQMPPAAAAEVRPARKKASHLDGNEAGVLDFENL